MAECPRTVETIAEDLTNDTLFVDVNTSIFIDSRTVELKSDIHRLKFLGYGVIGSVVIGLGILGNLINLVVLTRPNLKGVTFVYLTWLASSDLMTLLVSVTSLLRLHGIQPRSFAASFYYAYVELALVNAFMASSVFLVVALTIDRYFSICLPTRYKEVHNDRRARRSIIAAYVLAFCIYVPICFQKEPVPVMNQQNETIYVACENQDVFNHTGFRFYLLIKEIIVRIGPVILLAILNTTIIVAFRRTVRKRRELLNNSKSNYSQKESNRKFREERRLVVLLGGIVILFFVCMTPAAVLTLLNSDHKELDFGFQLFRAIANVLELANFAMNFYVYCLCSTEIRRTFLRLFGCIHTKLPEKSYISRHSLESSTRM
ncbi:probable G-protein coupled receptor AH9.1 [Limulus polyphemus]|uniref:Probable G-protein coupled receptor AH9.1 n=1 Tax=Limulus polyphemus TaxID=6850 RepID=A0ABM1B903_LIMPO|nr:probable G-protein coupled receptor AH9.1 [Limulus polyphemus]